MTTRRTFLRAGAALLGVSAVAAACSDDDDSAGETTTPDTDPPTTTVPATTTTVVETTTTTTAPAETTTTVAPDPVYPLLGTPLTDPLIGLLPALVVKIDNAPGARPQTGFDEADIVFEELVNDNLTRFAMVFHSRGSDPVGPCRSGRLQDVDLFSGFNKPLFAWSGGNKTVTAAIDASDLVNLSPSHARVYFRANDRKVPHNLYTNTTALWALRPPDSGPPPQQFRYRAPEEVAQGAPAGSVAVKLDSIDVRWTWDPGTALYLREMERAIHRDRATGQQISTNNVLVLVMNYLPGISDSPDAQTLGSGEAFLFAAGNVVHGSWSRAERTQPFTLTADDGSPMKLTPGRTFIELPRPGNVTPGA